MYQHNTSSWNLDRCNEVRKHTSGATVVLPGPLYIANKWPKKKQKNTLPLTMTYYTMQESY